MNVQAKSKKPVDWKRIILVAIVLGVAGYTWYSENFAGNDGGTAVAEKEETLDSDNDYSVTAQFPNASDDASKSQNSKPRDSKPRDSKPKNSNQFEPIKSSNSSASSNSNNNKKNKSGPFLSSAGGKNKKSPAGLIYGMGGGGEHRTDHVLRHAYDQPNRPSHGVFDADGDDVFRLIDEAYELVKQKSKRVKSEESRGNMAHVIDMQRKIGYKGGQSGKRSGNKPLRKIKLILAGGNRVITAYPY